MKTIVSPLANHRLCNSIYYTITWLNQYGSYIYS